MQTRAGAAQLSQRVIVPRAATKERSHPAEKGMRAADVRTNPWGESPNRKRIGRSEGVVNKRGRKTGFPEAR